VLLYAAAKGRTNFDASTRIDTATLTVKSGTDQIDAKILEPVKDMQGGGVWRVWGRVVGQLQNWPARLAAWLPMSNCQLAGGYIVEGDGVASKDGAELRQVGFAAEPLIVKSPWLNVNESRIEGTVAGSWNQQQRRLQIPSASMSCATAAVAAKNVVMAMPATGPLELTGALEYQGNAGRIGQWFANPKTPAAWQLAGQLKGSAVLQQKSRRGAWHNHHRTDQSRGRFRRQAIPRTDRSTRSRRRLRPELEDAPTQPMPIDLQRTNGGGRRPYFAGQRGTKRAD